MCIWGELDMFTLEDEDNSISSCASCLNNVPLRVVNTGDICIFSIVSGNVGA